VIVTYSTAKKKEFDIAVGNILGSNISNVFLIVGTSGILKNILFETSTYIASLGFLIISTIIFIVLNYKKKVTKNYGVALISFYFIYLVYVFI